MIIPPSEFPKRITNAPRTTAPPSSTKAKGCRQPSRSRSSWPRSRRSEGQQGDGQGADPGIVIEIPPVKLQSRR
jgi:hypothetical protein